MHYIDQALNPYRILNHNQELNEKETLIDNKVPLALKSKEAGNIELHLTDKCNLKCSHCHFRNQGDKHISFKYISKISSEIKPKAITIAGGGEPTCYPYFDKAIVKLHEELPNTKIGVITNGVFIPEGFWKTYVDWLRVSLYTLTLNNYCGIDAKNQDKVITNIIRYLKETNIPKIGVSLLYNNDNLIECIKLSQKLFQIIEKNGIGIERFNLQFKLAFNKIIPTKLTTSLHKQNKEFLPNKDTVINALEYLGGCFDNNKNYKMFMNTCSNYSCLLTYTDVLDKMLAQSDPNSRKPINYKKCYVGLIFRLITPDGFVYPCPTIAEDRNKAFSIGHIDDSEEIYEKNVLKYYEADSDWCNHLYCRHNKHNTIIKNMLNDYFF